MLKLMRAFNSSVPLMPSSASSTPSSELRTPSSELSSRTDKGLKVIGTVKIWKKRTHNYWLRLPKGTISNRS